MSRDLAIDRWILMPGAHSCISCELTLQHLLMTLRDLKSIIIKSASLWKDYTLTF